MDKKVEIIKKLYPHGTRIELVNMEDLFAPVPPGTKGTVRHVDDIGTIHMQWDNGRSLALIPDEDEFKVISPANTLQERTHRIVPLGDDADISIPNVPIDCSALGYFDELEEECWNLMKKYCDKLGIEMLYNESGQMPVSYDITKRMQDNILEILQESGVKFNFDGDIGEGKDNLTLRM